MVIIKLVIFLLSLTLLFLVLLSDYLRISQGLSFCLLFLGLFGVAIAMILNEIN